MLCKALPAAGPNLDCWPYAGHAGAALRCTKRHRRLWAQRMHISAPPAAALWEPRAASGPEELRDLERTYASTHAYLGTAGHGTCRGLRAASGLEELRDSEWSH